MNLSKYIKKILALGTKLSNPPFFEYSVFHYLNMYMPYNRAKKIAQKNEKAYLTGEYDFKISTYDGSNQAVHPDMIYLNGKYWLVVTPYPYGMEEYENPCIYCGDAFLDMKQCFYNPIEIQKKHKIGCHLSDPCIFEIQEKLACIYRENIRENGKEISFIYLKIYDAKDSWSTAKIVTTSETDLLLSPAIYIEDELPHMIHVRKTENGSMLIHSELDEMMNIKVQKQEYCIGIPKDFYIWHISITYKNGKKGSGKDKLFGLFLLRSSSNSQIFRLYRSEKVRGEPWYLCEEIRPNEAIKKTERHPYKSCFIPNSGEVLYSYIDKKSRYRMTVLETDACNI